jgi:hypothetical protein
LRKVVTKRNPAFIYIEKYSPEQKRKSKPINNKNATYANAETLGLSQSHSRIIKEQTEIQIGNSDLQSVKAIRRPETQE